MRLPEDRAPRQTLARCDFLARIEAIQFLLNQGRYESGAQLFGELLRALRTGLHGEKTQNHRYDALVFLIERLKELHARCLTRLIHGGECPDLQKDLAALANELFAYLYSGDEEEIPPAAPLKRAPVA